MAKKPKEIKWHVTSLEELIQLKDDLEDVVEAYRKKSLRNNILGCCVCVGSFIAILDLYLYM